MRMLAQHSCMEQPAEPWKPPTYALVQQTYEDAEWDRRRFFRLLSQRTGWTSRPYFRAPHLELRGGENLSICSFGDSVTRELVIQLDRLRQPHGDSTAHKS